MLASALLFGVWIHDDVRVIASYGFGSGPGRHTGWGVLGAPITTPLLPTARPTTSARR